MNQVEIKLQTLAARPAVKMKQAAKRGDMAPVLKHAGKVRQEVKKNNQVVPRVKKDKYASSRAGNNVLNKHMSAINMQNVTSDADLNQDYLNKFQPKGKTISWPEAHRKLLKMGYKHVKNNTYDYSMMDKKPKEVSPFVSIYKHPSFGKHFRLDVVHNENGVKEASNSINGHLN